MFPMPRRLLPVPMLLSFILVPLWSQAAVDRCDHLVAIGAGERPPYLWEVDGEPAQGASVHLVQRLAKELGVTVEILAADTLAQAEDDVISGRADLLIDAQQRPDVSAGLDLLHPPLHQAPVVAWAARHRAFAYQHWEDLLGLRGVRIDAAEQGMEEIVAPLQLGEAMDLTQAVTGVLNGQSDYFLYEQPAGQAAALGRNWADQVQVLLPPVYYRPHYLALSHSSACNSPRLRERLVAALQRMEAEAVSGPLLRQQVQHWFGRQVVD